MHQCTRVPVLKLTANIFYVDQSITCLVYKTFTRDDVLQLDSFHINDKLLIDFWLQSKWRRPSTD